MSRRRAVTLVELAVGLAVLAVLAGVLQAIMSGTLRGFRQAEGTTNAMQSALLAAETVTDAVRGVACFGAAPSSGSSWHGVTVGDADGAAWGPSLTLPGVTFRVGPRGADGGRSLVAESGASSRALEGCRLAGGAFRIIEASSPGGRPLYYVAMHFTGLGDDERDATTVATLVALDAATLRAAAPRWVENPATVPPEAP